QGCITTEIINMDIGHRYSTSVTFAQPLQVAGDAMNGFADIIHLRQEHDTEMIRVRPVERRALDDQYLLLAQQVERKGLVILDAIHLGIKAREQVQSRRWLHATDAGNFVEHLPGQVTLATKTSGRQDQVVDA